MRSSNQIERFRRSLRAGTGRAYLMLRDDPGLEVFEDIRDGICANYALDQQVEGPRAVYMHGLMNLSRHRDELIDVVVEGVETCEEGWNLAHLYAIAALLASEGVDRARHAMYRRFTDFAEQRYVQMWYGAEKIAELDGLEGFLFVVEQMGRHLMIFRDAVDDGSHVDWFARDNPEIDVQKELESRAEASPAIARYVEVAEETRIGWAERRTKREGTDYEIIAQYMERRAMLPWAGVNLEEMSTQDVERLAADFRRETDPKRRELYLRLFSKVRYPGSYEDILKALVLKDEHDWPAGEYSYGYDALAWFSHEKVRAFALERLSSDDPQIGAVSLLVYNYREGDAEFLVRLAEECEDEGALHDLTVRTVAVYQRNRTPECREPLEIHYRKGNCGMHRLGLLEVLHRNYVLSEEILEEMEFDSYREVRKLYRRIKRTADQPGR